MNAIEALGEVIKHGGLEVLALPGTVLLEKPHATRAVTAGVVVS